MSKTVLTILAVTSTLVLGGMVRAQAATVLNFAGLNATSNETVLNYYDGGFGGLGSGPGPNFGITFSSDTETCNAIACITNLIPGGPGANEILGIRTGDTVTMDVSAGFTTGLSFSYTSPLAAAAVEVFSGLDGTGTLLASLTLPATPAFGPGCGAEFCPYEPINVTFSGTAESVTFAGSESPGFADITLASTPSTPLPATLPLFATGLGALGLLGWCRKRKALAAVA